MNKKIKVTAQVVYDLQNLGVMNGNDMHDFFREVVGTPSPKGRVEIDKEKFEDFIASCLIAMHLNSEPSFIKTLMMREVRKIFSDLQIEKMHSKAFKASVRINPLCVYPDLPEITEKFINGVKYFIEGDSNPIFDTDSYRSRNDLLSEDGCNRRSVKLHERAAMAAKMGWQI